MSPNVARMTQQMIRTEGLTKTFVSKKKTVEAVRGLDLTVERGEMVAFLGPNGAGKSTTLRMLTTLIPPTSGTALVAGFDVTAQQAEVRQRIGYIGQGNGAGHNHKGRDELVMQGRTYGMGKEAARTRAAELIESLHLDEVADRKVTQLSGGQRRRLDIAMGLIQAPELLFLDEPSTGLDPQNRANLQEHIVALRAKSDTTIVLTTHYLDEADSLAERVVVIDHGLVVADDTPERLKTNFAGDRITVGFGSDEAAARAAARTEAGLDGAVVTHHGPTVEIRVPDGTHVMPTLLREYDADGTPVVTAEVVRPTLDDVFLNLTGRSLREGGADPNATDTGVDTGSGEKREVSA
jgi:ABC-2 type transport system ATP-binding protein